MADPIISKEMWDAFEDRYLRDLGLEEAVEMVLAPLIEAAAIERCAKKLEDDAKLLDEMCAVYPGDPCGSMGEEAELLLSVAENLRKSIGEKGIE